MIKLVNDLFPFGKVFFMRVNEKIRLNDELLRRIQRRILTCGNKSGITMKKPILLCIILIFGGILLQAQPTLTSVNNPLVGQRYYYRNTDTIAQPGAAGQGQTWNFTNVQVTLNTTIVNYVSPASTPHGASFPGSNLAAYTIPGEYEYFTTNANGYLFNGKGSSNDIVTITGSNYAFYTYPFQYGSTVVNTISGSSNAGTITGTVTITGDGTGTLKLPAITYNNVLRVKREENITYSFGPGVDENILTVSYFWYSATHAGPLMKLVTSTTSGIATGYTKYVGVADFGLGVDDIFKPSISEISIHPNPASNSTQVSFVSMQPSEVQFKIMDLTGKIWKEWSHNSFPGEASLQLDVASLPRGIYLLSAYSEGTIRQNRLILQ